VKKVLSYIIAFAYLLFSTGFSVNTHFCMGETDSITIGIAVSDVCGNCGMHTNESKGCCSDETAIYKITDEQYQQDHETHNPATDFAVIDNNCIFDVNAIAFNQQQIAVKPIHKPPLIKDRCVLFQTFLI
jgi:hypothetical protein